MSSPIRFEGLSQCHNLTNGNLPAAAAAAVAVFTKNT